MPILSVRQYSFANSINIDCLKYSSYNTNRVNVEKKKQFLIISICYKIPVINTRADIYTENNNETWSVTF